MKLPWKSADDPAQGQDSKPVSQEKSQRSNTGNQNSVLNYEGKQYDINSLPKEAKDLLQGLKVADAQLSLRNDTIGILRLGRQALGEKINEKLKEIKPLSEK